jgi:hypothetical protein
LLLLSLVGLATRDTLRGESVYTDEEGEEVWDLDGSTEEESAFIYSEESKIGEWEDESLDFADYHYDGMVIQQWGKLYSRNPKEAYLAVARLHPAKRGNSKWVVVDKKFRLKTIDAREDNIKLTRGGFNYQEVPGRSKIQEDKILTAAQAMIEKANQAPSVGSRVLMAFSRRKKSARSTTVVDLAEWLGSAVIAAWTKYQFGLGGAAIYVVWRTWQFWDVTPKVTSGYTKVKDFVETVESMNDAYEQIKVEYSEGNLDFVW